jgi:hypothetical protein
MSEAIRAHVIENGRIANTILVASLDALPGMVLVDADLVGGQIGDAWDETAGQPIPSPPPGVDLATIKVARNAEINTWRAAANVSTFPHAGKVIACDALSRSDIDGVANHIALFGTFPAGFPGAWKAVDNTLIPLPDVDAFRAMYASMTAQGTENFNHSQSLKAALALATTPEEVAAIEW